MYISTVLEDAGCYSLWSCVIILGYPSWSLRIVRPVIALSIFPSFFLLTETSESTKSGKTVLLEQEDCRTDQAYRDQNREHVEMTERVRYPTRGRNLNTPHLSQMSTLGKLEDAIALTRAQGRENNCTLTLSSTYYTDALFYLAGPVSERHPNRWRTLLSVLTPPFYICNRILSHRNKHSDWLIVILS